MIVNKFFSGNILYLLFFILAAKSIRTPTATIENNSTYHLDDGHKQRNNSDSLYYLRSLKYDQSPYFFNNKTDFKAEKDVIFYLYTRDNGGLNGSYEILDINDPDSIFYSDFDPVRPTRITIHGWLKIAEIIFEALHITVKNTYLSHGDYNFIAVDWTKGSMNEYTIAASFVEDVGYIVAKLIDLLHYKTNCDLNTIYIIGHSFGAHAAGFAGKYMKSGKLGVIYGLDPALHLFYTNNLNKRLSYDDANYVEIIHTNAFIFGYVRPIGDTDFYANNGIWQPGCTPAFCSHLRVISLFSESILTNKHFLSARCLTYSEIIFESKCTVFGRSVIMGGEPARRNRRGIYYFPTNSHSPFARGYLNNSKVIEIV